MSRTIQFRRLGAATIANTTGANGELIINSTDKTLTVHDGITPGGFALLSSTANFDIDSVARATANGANGLAQGAYNTANGANGLAAGAFNAANNLSGSVATAYNEANAAFNIANNAFNLSVTNANEIVLLKSVETSQNTRLNNNDLVNITQNTNIINATNLAQAAYNYANTISVSGIDQFARDTANSKFSSSGGQITGNVIIVGDLDVTDNTVVTNSVEANNVIIDGSLKTGLAARSSVVLPHLIAQFASNSATYVQTNSQNINPEGSADWVVTADNGTDTDFYIDMGLHGSQAYDKVLTPYDGYLFVQGSTIGQAGGNLIIGTTSSFPGLETMFVAGGYEANNVVMKLGTGGANVVGDLIVTGQIIGPTINTISGGGVTGNISVTATRSEINFVANSSGDGFGFSTIELVPDTNTLSDQRLIIDPTTPGHIHIRAGGVQDSSGAELFLGGEKHYVRVVDGQGVRIQNEETNDIYNLYSNTVQYVDGTWYEVDGNYFIQFTTDDSQMVTDLSNFASGGSPNEVLVYWNPGTGVVSNTMTCPNGFWQGIGNVYTAQVNSTLTANNTVLTAIEFHLFTTRTNFLRLENNDFTVDVTDDVRINARDLFSLRNWSTTDSIDIITDYDNQSHAWEFGANGVLYLPSPSANSEISSRDNLILTTNTDGFAAKKWLFDTNGGLTFPTGGQIANYPGSVGASNNSWFLTPAGGQGGISSQDGQQYIQINDNLFIEIGTGYGTANTFAWQFGLDGSLRFPEGNVQTGAAISITELKALVANCATYGDFQTAIANL